MSAPGPSPPITTVTSAARTRSRHVVEVVDPEREVVAAHLEQLRGLALDVVGDLLVEHDEARVRTVDPPEVDGPALRRRLPGALRELLDLVGGDAQAEDVAVEPERDLHVPHADRDVRHRFDGHAADTTAARARAPAWYREEPAASSWGRLSAGR